MNLPTSETTERFSFNSKRRVIFIASFFVILVISLGLLFSKQIEKVGYKLLGKVFPGSHVKVEGTRVKGFVDGNKVDHLAGIVKNVEPSTSGTRLTIEWEGDEKVVLIDPKATVLFGPKKLSEQSEGNRFRQGSVSEIKIDDAAMLNLLENLSNGEVGTKFVTIVR